MAELVHRRTTRGAVALLLALSGTLVSGCSLFDGDDADETTSVFDLEPGMCFQTPDEATSEIESLSPVDCGTDHTQEFISDVTFPTDETGEQFPGQEALDDYAQGACAQAFESYLGISYLDSDLFLTYLLPSARSWDQDDRSISCFVTSAGAPLQGSVEGSKR